MMDIEISEFTIDAYDTVFTLWKRCEGVGLSAADERESIQAYLDRNPHMSFVALADGNAVGAILGGHDGRRGYIHHLAVDSTCRRQGLGRRLVERCLAALAAAGMEKCHIFIFNGNAEGISFWKSVGWTPRTDISIISRTIAPVVAPTTCALRESC